MPEMYVFNNYGVFELRQTRYRLQRCQGREHPHDVCAVARSKEELRAMCEKHWPTTDWDSVDSHTSTPKGYPDRDGWVE